MSPLNTLQQLQAEWITRENFRRYGQVIFASKDGKPYNLEDAQLNLHNGTPRFYIMRLQRRGRKFHTITRHAQCTQCLGSLEGKDWLIAVAPPNNDLDKPALQDIAAFRIPGNCFIKLEVGLTLFLKILLKPTVVFKDTVCPNYPLKTFLPPATGLPLQLF